jgi:hypothetical protein
MDFMNRGTRSPQSPAHHTEGVGSTSTGNKFGKGNANWGKIGYVGFFAAVAILIIAILFSLVVTKNYNEESSVNKSKFQAVFLNGGQVYFGKISDLNRDYLKMGNIYYLRVNQTVQPNQQNNNAANDISLVKLGCELHGPEDSMVINREQVIFWENLKDDGQVAKAVAEYVKQNPNGQKCDQQNNSSSNSTTTPAANTTTNTTTPAANTTNNSTTNNTNNNTRR